MKEIIVYTFLSISSLIMLSYTVHMFIGGLVSERTEYITMAVVTCIGACVIALLARDVVRRRRAAAQQSHSDEQRNEKISPE